MNFASLGLPAPILKGVRAAGLTEATAIQSKAIPIILQGNDLIGQAQSGSGKTGAYCLPILARLLDSSSRLRSVVLVPTRELAQYVETRARDYARFTDIRIAVVFTGAPLTTQERMLREQGVDLLVATPGRLLELHARGCLNFADIEILVLDEADRMVGLGHGPDLRKLLKLLPETRQTVMFSATLPPELNRLAKEALIEPVRVDVGLPAGKPAAGITQAVYPVPAGLKTGLLDEMLARAEVRSTVVYVRSRSASEKLARLLQRRGYAVGVLDDHLSQSEREQALEDLKRGRMQILVASNTAARSLDVTGIAHVVNFDVPQTAEDYVQRLGRTGRGDSVGDAFTLMSPDEQKDVAAIERLLGRAIPRVLLPDFDYGMQPGEIDRSAAFNNDDAAAAERVRPVKTGLQAAGLRIASAGRAPVPESNNARSPARTAAHPAPARPAAKASTRPAAVARPHRAHSGHPASPKAGGARAKAPKTNPRGPRPAAVRTARRRPSSSAAAPSAKARRK